MISNLKALKLIDGTLYFKEDFQEYFTMPAWEISDKYFIIRSFISSTDAKYIVILPNDVKQARIFVPMTAVSQFFVKENKNDDG